MANSDAFGSPIPGVTGTGAIHLLQVISGLELAHGGPSYSVPRLNGALRAAGIDSRVLADVPPGDPSNDAGPNIETFNRQFARTPGLKMLHMSQSLARRLATPDLRVNLIHSHGLWRMPNLYAAWAARRRGIPIVVSPRGMLSEAALQLSAPGKRIFWYLGQKAALDATACFHATSSAEYNDLRRFGISVPIAVIPNGVDLVALPDRVGPRQAGLLSSQRTALFLGRIHPIKGIDALIGAWGRVASEFPQWRLRIVGPGESIHISALADLIARKSVPRVSMEGALAGEAKFQAFAEADVFVQPSYSENFGLTVAESLACRRPVLVTKGAPWPGVVTHGCGWWIDTGEEALVAGLRVALATPDDELDAMGRRGEAWVREAFAWDVIGQQMAGVYRWLLGQGPRPDCVQ